MAFTYFFRDKHTLGLISDKAVPHLRGHRYINIWDAGCAHGPEPYSLAIILRESMSHMLFRNVRIYATDTDTCDQFGKIITAGIYPAAETQRIPAWIRAKYFKRTDQPGHHQLTEEIRSRVTFVKHDLLSLEPVRMEFSLIVCKNVLLHFEPLQRVNVIRMFHSALRNGGFLVTENTQKLPIETERYFQKVTAAGQIFRKIEVTGTHVPTSGIHSAHQKANRSLLIKEN